MNKKELIIERDELERKIQDDTDELNDLLTNTEPKIKLLRQKIKDNKQKLISIKNNLLQQELIEKIKTTDELYFSVGQLPDYLNFKAELEKLKGTYYGSRWNRYKFWLTTDNKIYVSLIIYMDQLEDNDEDKIKNAIIKYNFKVKEHKRYSNWADEDCLHLTLEYKHQEKITKLPKRYESIRFWYRSKTTKT